MNGSTITPEPTYCELSNPPLTELHVCSRTRNSDQWHPFSGINRVSDVYKVREASLSTEVV